ncbi:MAG: hypothetical protein CVV25_06400 [Ignavibacteriae bacterium HGW-Ignavibacteriae-4]|jgi:hypothetical protein|nr:MAG: hypothetical protein CVV25_06400 [Ignavibacteriae bacterium HGW-Ignavibacteriae-4]
MKKIIIILLFLTTCNTYSQIEWELAKEMKNFHETKVEAFSKDTFIISTYFNSLRNENITFEWSIHLTTDRGTTWSRIYQDSVSLADIPRRERRIDQIEVTKNSVIAFTREDGYLLTSNDYGKTWDSLLVFLPYERGTLLDSYEEYLACYTNEDYIIIYNTITKDTNHINIPELDIDFGGDNVHLLERHLYMRSINEFYFVYTDVTPNASYSYLHITKDGGGTWEIRKHPRYYMDVVFLNDDLLYASGSISPTASGKGEFIGIIDKSTDGGLTWNNVVNANEVEYPFVFSYIIGLYVSNNKIIGTLDTYNAISTKKDEDNWKFDNLEPMTFVNSDFLLDIACDDNDNCLGAFRYSYIVRNKIGTTSVAKEIKDLNTNYKNIEIYDLNGQKLYEKHTISDKSNLELQNGLYLKVYKDFQNNIIKTEKLFITK